MPVSAAGSPEHPFGDGYITLKARDWVKFLSSEFDSEGSPRLDLSL